LGLPFHQIELATQSLVTFFPELVTAMDEPIADIAGFGHYSVMQLARDHGIKVMLSGLGGDELFWGYAWVGHAASISELKAFCAQRPAVYSQGLRLLQTLVQHPWYQRLGYSSKVPDNIKAWVQPSLSFGRANLDHADRAVFYELVPDFAQALAYRASLLSAQVRAQLADDHPFRPFQVDRQEEMHIAIATCQRLCQTWLASNCLALGDRVSMACSVETRLPLLDQGLAETVIGLRKTQSDHRLPPKAWLKAALDDILPPDILNRPKRGFQPPSLEWMAAIIQHYYPALLEGYLVDSNVINRDRLKQMVHEFLNDQRHCFMLYKAVVLETWYRQIVLKYG
jgi:asparagine synthase (glutamine-hydrolysing)